MSILLGGNPACLQSDVAGLALSSSQSKNFFKRVLAVLDSQMTEPAPFGWFHFIFLALTALACALVIYKCRNIKETQLRKVLFSTSIVLIVLEIYKQINFSYNTEEDTWRYAWSAFPFQFCSSPLYIMPLAVLIRKERLRKRLYAFLGSYCFIAGLVVMLFPTTVFTETIGVNLQTMIHHGAMIVIAVLLLASNTFPLNARGLVLALPVFLVLGAMAMEMNGLYILWGDASQDFNMFYISPANDPPADILVTLLEYIPYIVYLLGYLAFFTLGAYLVLLFARLLSQKFGKERTKNAQVENGGNTKNKTSSEELL